jgi:hypothetical protein
VPRPTPEEIAAANEASRRRAELELATRQAKTHRETGLTGAAQDGVAEAGIPEQR